MPIIENFYVCTHTCVRVCVNVSTSLCRFFLHNVTHISKNIWLLGLPKRIGNEKKAAYTGGSKRCRIDIFFCGKKLNRKQQTQHLWLCYKNATLLGYVFLFKCDDCENVWHRNFVGMTIGIPYKPTNLFRNAFHGTHLSDM